jgi:ligand-binding sensor domain-containing protein
VVVRYHGEVRTLYGLSWDQVVTDIFAQDQHHIWFAVRGYDRPYSVLGLYDNGTPADTGDDVWRTYPIELVEGNVVVAVDANGQLWHGQGSGLYRYDGAAWQLVYGERPICDLTPAADGTLYAQVRCGGRGEILVVRPDGTIEDRLFSIEGLIKHELATVQTARRRNSLWSVASDGAIWYIDNFYAGQEVRRRTSSGLTTYSLPVDPVAVRRLDVDSRGHVWLLADSQLWRMEGPRPIHLYLPVVSR